jgi:dephospho-CoA kinase
MAIGLTGGVGSGKSTVAALLAEHGAVIVDADLIAREVVEPGTPGLAAVVDEFGPGILGPNGSLDRPKLAAVVFDDAAARLKLNAILHPIIQRRSDEVAAQAGPGAVVIYDVPLLVEGGPGGRFDKIIVVEAPVELRLERLAARGLPREQAMARMAAQASDEQRRSVADELIINDGSLQDLKVAVDAVWDRLASRRTQVD